MFLTVSPIGSLSNTPRLGATVFTSWLRKLPVAPFPPSNTVILPRLICSNAFTCSPAISFHWSTILYWIAIAGFDSAASTIARKPSASANNDFFLPSASASSFIRMAEASASACANRAFARASASRIVFSATASACRIASCLATSAGTIFWAFKADSTFFAFASSTSFWAISRAAWTAASERAAASPAFLSASACVTASSELESAISLPASFRPMAAFFSASAFLISISEFSSAIRLSFSVLAFSILIFFSASAFAT